MTNTFTGNTYHRVNHTAGKPEGVKCLFPLRDAMFQKDLGRQGQGHWNPWIEQGIQGVRLQKQRKGLGSTAFVVGIVVLGILLIPEAGFAHDGELFQDQITKLEKLFTGGYMRLGLLAICGVTAVAGAIKQNGMVFLTGILAGVFAYFMRDWIQLTFACIV